MQPRTRNLTLWLIGVGLLFPLFIQLSGGIYNSAKLVTDSGGVLSTLPLPLSIAACVFGVLALCRNYRQAAPAVVFIAALVPRPCCCPWCLPGESTGHFEPRKVLLAAQFLLPTMGLVLGQLVRDEDGCDSAGLSCGC
jgi:hypothetical protein